MNEAWKIFFEMYFSNGADIFVFVIAFLMKLNLLLRDSDAVTLFLNAIPEGLMINSVGVFGGGVNPASWYVSVLMVGGGIIYAILYCSKKVALGVVFPLLVLFSYTYLLGIDGSISHFATRGALSQCLLRGMAGMALGAVQAITAAGRTVGKDIYLVGVDALDEAVELVNNGGMTGTVLNDHVGQSHTAVDAAIKAVNGEKLEAYYWVDYVKVTKAE